MQSSQRNLWQQLICVDGGLLAIIFVIILIITEAYLEYYANTTANLNPNRF